MNVYLINNAGTIGPQMPLGNIDPNAIEGELRINVSSPAILSRSILNAFVDRYIPARENTKIALVEEVNKYPLVVIVNISSLAAMEPMQNWTLYCMAKAARDMLMRSIALDYPYGETGVRTLSYAPGPMATDMHKYAREKMPDGQHKQMLQSLVDEDKVVSSDVSAAELGKLLAKNDWVNGSHIDLYDVWKK
jgi:sepiapterin reductase